MGIFDALTGLSPEQNAGLLGFGAQLLSNSSNPYRPTDFGSALQAGQHASQDAQRRKQEEAAAQQMAAMRALQMRGMQGDLQTQERASAQQARIEESARKASQNGQFDAAAFVNDVRSYDPLTATKYEQQFAKAAPKFDSGITFVNGPDGKPVAVRTADDGSIKQVEGILPREKADILHLGGVDRAVNLHDVRPGETFQRTATPDALLSASVSRENSMRTDARARDFNAISQEANSIKRGEKQREADLGKAGQVASFDTMLGTLDRLKAHPGLPRSVGLYSKAPTMPGSDSANFQAELETFKSQAFVPMVAQLKGMGALSDAEGRKLTAAIGALDPSMSETEFTKSIDRIYSDMNSARRRVVSSSSPALQQSLAAPEPQSTAPKAAQSIPQGAIGMLKMNPKLREQFDAKYGAGASATVLGK